MSSKKFSWEMGGMNWCTSLTNIPLVLFLLVWGPVVWIPRRSPYERDCYLMGTRFESQTTGPQTQQLTIAKAILGPQDERSVKFHKFFLHGEHSKIWKYQVHQQGSFGFRLLHRLFLHRRCNPGRLEANYTP